MDDGVKRTELTGKQLERRIISIYKEAEKDIDKKLQDFNKKFATKYNEYRKQFNEGKITEADWKSWLSGQVFQIHQWQEKKEQIVDTITNANKVAVGLINKQTSGVFMYNANYMAYDMEVGASCNFGFGLYDRNTVSILLKDNPQMLPEWKINEPKDYIWNEKKVNAQTLQGILQGESLDDIAKRISKNLSSQNENLMKTFARTAMTGAQNAGRLARMHEADSLGIKIEKEWMATLDGFTRDSHADIDGESVPLDDEFSNQCLYPGDPGGPPAEVYNCRCTMVSNIKKYPAKYQRYDNINGKPIEGMTYREWEEEKRKSAAPVSMPVPSTGKWIDICKNNPDVYQMLDIEHDMFESLPYEEKSALGHYTGSAYEEMNAYLRAVGSGMKKEWAQSRSGASDYDVRACELCHKALNEHRLTQAMVFRRGTDVGDLAGLFMQGDFDDNKRLLEDKTVEELNAMFKGQVGKYFGFTSTSSQWDRGFNGEVEVMVYAPPGTPAASIMSISSFGTGEGETLFRDNVTVVCEGIEVSDGHRMSDIRVFLRIIPD